MRLPVVPTLTVALGVPVLLYLGVWQLERRGEKAAELAAFARPQAGAWACAPLAGPVTQRGGRSRAGRTGYRWLATCRLGGAAVPVDLGWSARPVAAAALAGGPRTIRGLLFTVPDEGRLLVATEMIPPLRPSAPPNAADIPNNHLAYALQWFAFAGILPVIYALWLRRHRRDRGRTR